MSDLTEGIYAIQQVPHDKPIALRFATGEGVNEPIKVEPRTGTTFPENMLWHLKKSGDNWLIFTASSPIIPHIGGGPGPVVFGFRNDDVADGVPITVGSPSEYLLTHQEDGSLTIKPTNPPDGQFDLEYFVGVNGDSVEIKSVLIRMTDNTTIPSWVFKKVDTQE